jgi:cell pole-organizing protein PopZ
VLELGEIAQMAPADGDETPLLTENTRASMRDSLAALAAISGPGAAPQIVRSGETSLEGMVRDLLRPALAEWLDKNLPALVERLVAAEIARIVGKKG